MEETQSTDNFLALSPRAGRRLGIWEKETQASWPRHHPLASLGNYGPSRTRDLAQTPQLLASSGHLWFGVVMVLELEILSNYFLWPSYHIRDAYTSHLLPQVFLSPPPTYHSLTRLMKGTEETRFHRTPNTHLQNEQRNESIYHRYHQAYYSYIGGKLIWVKKLNTIPKGPINTSTEKYTSGFTNI